MSSETIDDIVREMRMGRTDGPDAFAYLIGRTNPQTISRKPWLQPVAHSIERVTVAELADRIEAAAEQWKTALEKIAEFADVDVGTKSYLFEAYKLGRIARQALHDDQGTP